MPFWVRSGYLLRELIDPLCMASSIIIRTKTTGWLTETTSSEINEGNGKRQIKLKFERYFMLSQPAYIYHTFINKHLHLLEQFSL